MQQRHLDRQTYFQELAGTSRDYYLDYLTRFCVLGPHTRVLEVGCGEGGNLLPFAERGCEVTGIDRAATRIMQARTFFQSAGYTGTFTAIDFLAMNPHEYESYDLILIHDVLEHVSNKPAFMNHVKGFLKETGLVFWGFPAWQMPFGGHQQICKGKVCSSWPFLHLFPMPVYRFVLSAFEESRGCIEELTQIKQCRVTVESFEKLAKANQLAVVDRCLWFINPHYKQKFGLKPKILAGFLGHIKYVRNFFATSCFYITRQVPI